MDVTVFAQQALCGLTNGMAYAMFAVGLTLIFGVMGTLSIAHGEFYMLGALVFCSFVTYLGINYLLAALATLALLGVAGIAVSRIAVLPLLDGPNPFMSVLLSTIGVSIFLTNIALSIWGASTVPLEFPLQGGIPVGIMELSWARIVISGVTVVVMVTLHLFLSRTLMGKKIRAISQNRIGASLVGINLNWEYSLTFGIGCALAALAGTLSAPIWVASPYLGQTMILTGFVVVIVGGLGSIRGALVVGLLLGVLQSIFGYFLSVYYRDALTFAVLIITLLLKPRGLFQR